MSVFQSSLVLVLVLFIRVCPIGIKLAAYQRFLPYYERLVDGELQYQVKYVVRRKRRRKNYFF